MAATVAGTTALGDHAARQLANATKTAPQLSTISPRWLTHLLQWVPVEAGIYRLTPCGHRWRSTTPTRKSTAWPL